MMLKPFSVKSDDGKTFYADDAAPVPALTDEQREAIATAITALTTLGWTHQIPLLRTMLETK